MIPMDAEWAWSSKIVAFFWSFQEGNCGFLFCFDFEGYFLFTSIFTCTVYYRLCSSKFAPNSGDSPFKKKNNNNFSKSCHKIAFLLKVSRPAIFDWTFGYGLEMGPGRRFIGLLLRAVAFSWPLLGLSPWSWRCCLSTAAFPAQQIDRVKASGVGKCCFLNHKDNLSWAFFFNETS